MDATKEAPRAAEASPPQRAAAERSVPSVALRRVLIVVGAIVVLVALVYGAKFVAYATAHETTDDAAIDADQVQVTSKITERVDRIFIDTNDRVRRGQVLIQLDSQDESDRVTQAEAAARAQRAQVRAAQATVALTRETQQAQNLQNAGLVTQAQADVSSAAAQAASAASQIDVAQAGAAAARAAVQAARAALPGARENLRKAQADMRRTQSLVATGDLAVAQLDAMRAEYEAARSQSAVAEANVTTAVADLAQAQQKVDAQRFATGSTQAQIGVQEGALTTAHGRYRESDAPSRIAAQQAQADATAAQIPSLQAQLVTARNNLNDTRITAPIDGYVGQKNVEIGQTVSPGESLMTLIPATGVYITANFKETQVGRMKVGQEVDINVDAYSGVKFVGHVDNLSPASQNSFSLVPAQNATGNFVKVTQRLPVRILIDAVAGGKLSDYTLRPGMSVEASVKVK